MLSGRSLHQGACLRGVCLSSVLDLEIKQLCSATCLSCQDCCTTGPEVSTDGHEQKPETLNSLSGSSDDWPGDSGCLVLNLSLVLMCS